MSEECQSEGVLSRFLARTRPFHFWTTRGEIDTWPSERILETALRYAQVFRARGVHPGEIIGLRMETGPGLLSALFGGWMCGATLSVLPVIRPNEMPAYRGNQPFLAGLRPKLIAVDELTVNGAPQIQREALLTPDEVRSAPTIATLHIATNRAEDVALIQFTSGSAGMPKGVPLRHRALNAHFSAVHKRTMVVQDDHMVSWLPLYHDMGLGAVITAIWGNCDLTLIKPERFVRAPTTWLHAISAQRGTLSPGPSFAYRLVAKFASRFGAEGLDLASWRYAWVGAEPVFAPLLELFQQTFEPMGLAKTVLKPAYGLAEAVVAVTCEEVGREPFVIRVDAELLRSEGRAVLEPKSAKSLDLVGNGPPIPGIRVAIRNEDGVNLKDRYEGHVCIAGENVATGYLDEAEANRFDSAGYFDTGDLGFMHGGQLFISGRAKDIIIRGGANFHPHEIESVIQDLLELRPAQVAAFSDIDHASAAERVVAIICKRLDPGTQAAMTQMVARQVATEVGIQIDDIIFVDTPIPKTTSGKVQRSLARELYLKGKPATALQ